MVGIAGAGDDHLALLSKVAETFVDDDAGGCPPLGRGRAEDVMAVLDVVRV